MTAPFSSVLGLSLVGAFGWPTFSFFMDIIPTTFTDLKRMRLQECDRPKCMAIELAKVWALVVASADYDTLYVWPVGTPEPYIIAWHRDNNAGDKLIFHVGSTEIKATMPE